MIASLVVGIGTKTVIIKTKIIIIRAIIIAIDIEAIAVAIIAVIGIEGVITPLRDKKIKISIEIRDPRGIPV